MAKIERENGAVKLESKSCGEFALDCAARLLAKAEKSVGKEKARSVFKHTTELLKQYRRVV